MKRKEGGRGLISVEQLIREEKNSLGFYVANSEENLIKKRDITCNIGVMQKSVLLGTTRILRKVLEI